MTRVNIASEIPMKSMLDASFNYVISAAKRIRKSFAEISRRRAERRQLSDEIANRSSKTYAVDRWHVLAVALFVELRLEAVVS
jgi:hypothetical protein